MKKKTLSDIFFKVGDGKASPLTQRGDWWSLLSKGKEIVIIGKRWAVLSTEDFWPKQITDWNESEDQLMALHDAIALCNIEYNTEIVLVNNQE